MTLFFVLAGALLLLCIGIVLWPLWRGAAPAGSSRREANVAVYEQHRSDIERDLAAGQITQAVAEARREELGARLVADVDSPSGPSASGGNARPWPTTVIVVVVFCAAAVGLYSMLGDLRGLTLDERPDIARLVDRMKARLEAAPNDLRTRVLLARVQMARKQYRAAARSFAQINKRLDEPNVTYLLAEARARMLANRGLVDERTRALYEKVLQLAPDNTEALWFAGLAAVADGNQQAAIDYWTHLLELDISEDFRARVKRRLSQVRGEESGLRSGN